MLFYALKRLLLFIPLLFGDPVQAMVGPYGSQEFVAQVRAEFGLNRPLYIQYIDWLTGVLQGNLGITFRSRQPIAPLLLARVPATLELALGGLIIALLMGLPAGVIAGLNKNSTFDYIFSILSLGGYSMPIFWTGTLLLLLFGVHWQVLPSQGYVPFEDDPIENLKYLVMPAVTLGIALSPYIGRMARAAVIETLQEPFVAFARAKGLKRITIFARYVFRHAITAIVVVLGLDIGYLLSGQIIVEELFNWPGAGRVIVRSVLERDYFVVQASILIYAGAFLLINFAVELLHAWLDPRVQLS
jgi:peptide/nickel transport system permease protein